jgi:hypothetical protein
MRERKILCLEGGLVSPKLARITGCAALRRIFSSKKELRQTIGRKDSIQAICRRIRRLDGFLYEAQKNFELFKKIQDQNKKIKNL